MSISKKITLSIAVLACYSMSAMEKKRPTREHREPDRYTPPARKKKPLVGSLIFLNKQLKKESAAKFEETNNNLNTSTTQEINTAQEIKQNSSSNFSPQPLSWSATSSVKPYIVDVELAPLAHTQPTKNVPVIYSENQSNAALNKGDIDLNVNPDYLIIPNTETKQAAKRKQTPPKRFDPSVFELSDKSKKRKIAEDNDASISHTKSVKKYRDLIHLLGDVHEHAALEAKHGKTKHNQSFNKNGKIYNRYCHISSFGTDDDYPLTRVDPADYPLTRVDPAPSIECKNDTEETLKHLAMNPSFCIEDLQENNRPGDEVLFSDNAKQIFKKTPDLNIFILPSTRSSKSYSQSQHKNLYR